MTFSIETYGCQMNIAQSSALKHMLFAAGWHEIDDKTNAGVEFAEKSNAQTSDISVCGPDLVLLNTCSVRATAEQRVFGRIAHYNSLKKKIKARGGQPFSLVITGCMAERIGGQLLKQGADFAFGPQSQAAFPLILAAIEKRAGPSPYTEAVSHFQTEEAGYTFAHSHLEEGAFRSFLPVMNGCNNFCSYCIVPYVRGREISRDPAEIAAEIGTLASKNVREITLLGQNVNSYRWEKGKTRYTFPDLLEFVAEKTEHTAIERIRFLSSHPKDLSSRAIAVMAANKRYCRHLHLCVQHGSNAILSAMNRRYTRERYLELAGELRAAMPDISLSTDILVGFPGETEADFEQALTLMDEVRFLYAYTYHYNPREGTAAAALPNRVDDGVKRERLSRVIALQSQHTLELLRGRLGKREKALVEGPSRLEKRELLCRTERDETAVVRGPPEWAGHFVEITLASLKGSTFRAKDGVLCVGEQSF
jgi:tRNA-2-methylthio-N6-dimethylallyladenosine synthase